MRHFLIDPELFFDDEIRKKRSENKDCNQIVVQCGLFFINAKFLRTFIARFEPFGNEP